MKTRYFAWDPLAYTYYHDVGEITEVTKGAYDEICADNPDWEITEERHTVFENGVNQICFTVKPDF